MERFLFKTFIVGVFQLSLGSENGEIGQKWQMREDGVVESRVKIFPNTTHMIVILTIILVDWMDIKFN